VEGNGNPAHKRTKAYRKESGRDCYRRGDNSVEHHRRHGVPHVRVANSGKRLTIKAESAQGRKKEAMQEGLSLGRAEAMPGVMISIKTNKKPQNTQNKKKKKKTQC